MLQRRTHLLEVRQGQSSETAIKYTLHLLLHWPDHFHGVLADEQPGSSGHERSFSGSGRANID